MPDASDIRTHAIRLARDVKFFRMEFYDPQLAEWVPEWANTNQIPKSVRVALAVGGNPNQPDKPAQVLTRVVSITSSAVQPQYQMANAALAPGQMGPGGRMRGLNPAQPLPSDQNAQLPGRDNFAPVLPPGNRR